MGAKNSKTKKGDKVGVAGRESDDVVDKTATLPASFKHKESDAGKSSPVPRSLNRSTSFTQSCRNWAKKKGIIKENGTDAGEEAVNEVAENEFKENNKPEENNEVKSADSSKYVAKLAQKKARAQFFEDMYNSSGISVNSTLTPEKPKRLGEMNLPSPRIGNGTHLQEKFEGNVEHLAKQIEEKEKLNRSLDSEVISLNRSLEMEDVVAGTVTEHPAVCQLSDKADNHGLQIQDNNQDIANDIPEQRIQEEIMDDLLEAAKEESEETLDETLPSNARLGIVEIANVCQSPSAAVERDEQIETKEEELEAAVVEPSSLESMGTDDDDTKHVEEIGQVENVINGGADSSEEDEGIAASDDEEKKGAAGLRDALKKEDTTGVNSDELGDVLGDN